MNLYQKKLIFNNSNTIDINIKNLPKTLTTITQIKEIITEVLIWPIHFLREHNCTYPKMEKKLS